MVADDRRMSKQCNACAKIEARFGSSKSRTVMECPWCAQSKPVQCIEMGRPPKDP